MRGFAWRGGRLDPTERTLAPPTGDEVELEVEAAWLAPGPDGPIAGAAAIGIVRGAGEAASALVGRRALACATVACGECEVCRRGAVAACPRGGALGRDRDGALADVVRLRGRWLAPLDERFELGAVDGALIAGPAAVAYAIYARAGLAPGQPTVVVGRGAIAAALERIAQGKGARVDRMAPDEAIATARARAAALGGDGRPRAVLDAGEPGGATLAAALIEAGATLVLGPGAAASLDAAAIARAHAALIGVAGPHPDLLIELAALVVRKELALTDLAEVVSWSALPTLPAAPPERALIVARG